MKKSKKVAIIIAVCLICVGLIISLGVVIATGFNFMMLDSSVYVTNTHEITESISNIQVNTNTTDIKLLSHQEEDIKVVCFEREDKPHNITVENGTLKISNSKTPWYKNISFSFRSAEVTVYLPQTLLSNISIDTDTGYIEADGIYASSMNFETDTGYISLNGINESDTLSAHSDTGSVSISDATCDEITAETDTGSVTISAVYCSNLEAESDTGRVTIANTISENKINAETDTGDVIFDHSDAKSIYAKSSTGDIEGTVLTQKTFTARSSTGRVNVPNTSGSETFEAKTSTGDINISYTK